ncbi:MAG: restriction endonuclease subunit S, partial [Ruminococcus sp.]|nr:restriction endonuclease subunit S [Ruminococcus sp.]
GTHNWVSIADLSKTTKYIVSTKESITDLAVSETGIKATPKDTVVMSFKLSIGKTAVTAEETYTNEAIMSFTDKGVYDVDIDYIFHLFSGKDWSKGTNKAVMGVTLNKATLSQILIPLPPLETQRQIAANLDKVTHTIDLCNNILEKLDLLVKARFVEMFGDIVHDDNIPKVLLSELADIGSSKRIYANEYVDDGIPFYRSKEIRELGSGLKPTTELFITNERYKEIKKKYGVPKRGDILIAAIGATIGYSWIVDTEKPFYYKDGNLIILSVKDNVNSVFLNHTMGIIIEDFKNKGVSGSAQLALTIEKLEKMPIVNPDLTLQNQFAAFVEQTDKSKSAVKKVLEKAETLKKALMQEYFG